MPLNSDTLACTSLVLGWQACTTAPSLMQCCGWTPGLCAGWASSLKEGLDTVCVICSALCACVNSRKGRLHGYCFCTSGEYVWHVSHYSVISWPWTVISDDHWTLEFNLSQHRSPGKHQMGVWSPVTEQRIPGSGYELHWGAEKQLLVESQRRRCPYLPVQGCVPFCLFM